MYIHFGKGFDGQRGLILSNNSLGECVLGCSGLLNLLETHLGLLAVIQSQSERIVQYRNVLAAKKKGSFYESSFDLDELGTTKTLLQWRDSWYLHGWLGEFKAQNITDIQLRTMAQLEEEARSVVSPCEGQRLHNINKALEAGVKIPINELKIYDRLDTLPSAWRQVIKQLNPKEVVQKQFGQPDTMLRKVQDAVQNLDGNSIILDWQNNDETLCVVQADTPLFAAHWLADSRCQPQYAQCLLVADDNAALLDDVLAINNLPAQGLSDLTPFRPALQVLPLVLQQLWKPANIYALLELLTHPICPIPSFARRKLAELISEKPGINAKVWEDAIKNMADIDVEVIEKAWDKVKVFLLVERYEHRSGASVDRILDIVGQLVHYFHGRLASDKAWEIHAFVAAHRQCSVFIRSLEGLKSQGITTINEKQLQQLLEQATSQGSEHGLRVANLGSMAHVTQPAAVAGSHEQVIWWQPIMPTLPKNYQWSPTQLKILKEDGVDLPSASQQFKELADTWLRPILSASKQLTLILPSDEVEQHPVWLMLKTICPKIPVIKLEKPCFLEGQQGTKKIEAQPLPSLKHWWILPQDTFATVRDKDSYSSLSLQLKNPAQWILSYMAKIRPSQLQQIPDKATLQGNISHRLIECLFKNHKTEALSWDEVTLKEWYQHTFNRLVDEEAAIFRMYGHYNDGAVLDSKLYRAVSNMLHHFKQANVINIESEYLLNGCFEGGQLAGSADLMLTLATGEDVIVDMKWSGKKYFKDRLISNRQLQLAMYGEMYRQTGRAFARPAYFIIKDAYLFYIDQGLFPTVAALQPKTDESGHQLWERFLVTWRWRQAQLQKGEIEVTSQAVAEAFVLENPPEAGYELDKPSDSYNIYKHLMGWSAEA